jgi:hypothetical protein
MSELEWTREDRDAWNFREIMSGGTPATPHGTYVDRLGDLQNSDRRDYTLTLLHVRLARRLKPRANYIRARDLEDV